MHIGLIGGIGPAATEFYYRGLVRAHAAADRAMELTIVHADMKPMVRNMTENQPERQADAFLPLVERLKAAGADIAAVTSMTGHFCIQQLAAISPLPLANALPEIDAAIAGRGLKKVGLLGTRMVMGSRLYGEIPSAEIVLPEGELYDQTHDNYMAIATSGAVTDAQRDFFFSVGRELCEKQGAEAVLVGGTDLFLAFDGHDPGFSLIDCAEVHIEALYRLSVGGS